MCNQFSYDEAARALIESDAQDMIQRYGSDALHAARLHELAQYDGENLQRPPGHWRIVLDEIRRRQQPGSGR